MSSGDNVAQRHEKLMGKRHPNPDPENTRHPNEQENQRPYLEIPDTRPSHNNRITDEQSNQEIRRRNLEMLDTQISINNRQTDTQNYLEIQRPCKEIVTSKSLNANAEDGGKSLNGYRQQTKENLDYHSRRIGCSNSTTGDDIFTYALNSFAGNRLD